MKMREKSQRTGINRENEHDELKEKLRKQVLREGKKR